MSTQITSTNPLEDEREREREITSGGPLLEQR
jgi:hypothetical protein